MPEYSYSLVPHDRRSTTVGCQSFPDCPDPVLIRVRAGSSFEKFLPLSEPFRNASKDHPILTFDSSFVSETDRSFHVLDSCVITNKNGTPRRIESPSALARSHSTATDNLR